MIYFGLGANLGDRRANLEQAIARLVQAGFELRAVSPMVESPALLPKNADPEWHKPYFNLVIRGAADWSPAAGLAIAKRIERELGRRPDAAKWSPRPADIDLINWHDRVDTQAAPDLTLPHREAARRDFVLTPLLHLQPDLRFGGRGETVFARCGSVPPIPLWMAIINCTPNSFSDGGRWQSKRQDADAAANGLENYVDELLAANVQILDIGAESTRPGARPITADEEWARLRPALALIADKLRDRYIKPWLSVDTRRPEIAERALQIGADMINDQGGLRDPNMIAVARAAGCQAAAMHSLEIPPTPGNYLPDAPDAVTQIRRWAEAQMETWARAGLDMNKIILDPGIGFGKSNLQTFALLQNCKALRGAGLRLLIGHSRKSFMRNFAPQPAADRDFETIGLSLALCGQGVDILRVHNPLSHLRAYRGWAHARAAADG